MLSKSRIIKKRFLQLINQLIEHYELQKYLTGLCIWIVLNSWLENYEIKVLESCTNEQLKIISHKCLLFIKYSNHPCFNCSILILLFFSKLSESSIKFDCMLWKKNIRIFHRHVNIFTNMHLWFHKCTRLLNRIYIIICYSERPFDAFSVICMIAKNILLLNILLDL